MHIRVLPPEGGKACLSIGEHNHFTPTRGIKRHVRALARNHPKARRGVRVTVEVSRSLCLSLSLYIYLCLCLSRFLAISLSLSHSHTRCTAPRSDRLSPANQAERVRGPESWLEGSEFRMSGPERSEPGLGRPALLLLLHYYQA